MVASGADYLQCGFSKVYLRAWSKSLTLQRDLWLVAKYIKQEEARHAGGGGGEEGELVIPYKFNLHSPLDVSPI